MFSLIMIGPFAMCYVVFPRVGSVTHNLTDYGSFAAPTSPHHFVRPDVACSNPWDDIFYHVGRVPGCASKGHQCLKGLGMDSGRW